MTLRPSLSGALQLVVPETVQGVAGVDAPAFVERVVTQPTIPPRQHAGLRPSLSVPICVARVRPYASVAGVDAPAFVERLHEEVDRWLVPPSIPSSHTPPGSQAAVFRV